LGVVVVIRVGGDHRLVVHAGPRQLGAADRTNVARFRGLEQVATGDRRRDEPFPPPPRHEPPLGAVVVIRVGGDHRLVVHAEPPTLVAADRCNVARIRGLEQEATINARLDVCLFELPPPGWRRGRRRIEVRKRLNKLIAGEVHHNDSSRLPTCAREVYFPESFRVDLVCVILGRPLLYRSEKDPGKLIPFEVNRRQIVDEKRSRVAGALCKIPDRIPFLCWAIQVVVVLLLGVPYEFRPSHEDKFRL